MLPRRLPALLAVVLLTVPVVALAGRPAILFLASFDESADDPTSGLQAEVGMFDESEAADVFSVVETPAGDGVLQVFSPGDLDDPASLEGLLASKFSGTKVEIDLSITPSQTTSTLLFRAEDDGSTGAIDGGFGDGGGILVNGDDIGLTYEPGIEYHLSLTLVVPLLGLPTWTAEVTWEDEQLGTQQLVASGLLGLAPGTSLKIDRVVLEVPADASPGVFEVDDIGVFGLTYTSTN